MILRPTALIASLLLLLPLALALAPAALALDADELEAKLLEAWQRQKSITADLRIEAEMMGIAVTGTGDLAILNEGESSKYTQHFVLELPAPLSVQATMNVLYDGQSVYLVREMLGEKEAFKLAPGLAESAPPPGGQLLFDLVKAQYSLEVQDDAAVDKRPAYMLHCEPKDADAADPMTIAFDKETGLALRIEIHTADAEKPVVIACTNVATGAELNPASFVFTLADGTQLQDKTPAAPTEAPKPEAPKADELPAEVVSESPAPVTEAAPDAPAPTAGEAPASEQAPAQQ